MATINFNDLIIGFNGKPILFDNANMTLNDVCQVVLLNDQLHKDDTAEEKLKCFNLAFKLNIGKPTNTVDVTVEEIVLLKKLIGVAFNPLVVGLSYAKLEGNNVSFVTSQE